MWDKLDLVSYRIHQLKCKYFHADLGWANTAALNEYYRLRRLRSRIELKCG